MDNLSLKEDIRYTLDELRKFMKNHDLIIVVYNDKEFVSAGIIGDTLETSFAQNVHLKNRVKSRKIKSMLYLNPTTEILQVIVLVNNDGINSIDHTFGTVNITGVLRTRICMKMFINLQYNTFRETMQYVAEEIKEYIKNLR